VRLIFLLKTACMVFLAIALPAAAAMAPTSLDGPLAFLLVPHPAVGNVASHTTFNHTALAPQVIWNSPSFPDNPVRCTGLRTAAQTENGLISS
jgi:hypothetical protein